MDQIILNRCEILERVTTEVFKALSRNLQKLGSIASGNSISSAQVTQVSMGDTLLHCVAELRNQEPVSSRIYQQSYLSENFLRTHDQTSPMMMTCQNHTVNGHRAKARIEIHFASGCLP